MMLNTKGLTFLAATLVATSLSAQESVGSVLGTVREPGGVPAVGATLVISGDAILVSRTLVTDQQGNFRFNLLLPGQYTLTVSKPGFIGSKSTFRVAGGGIVRQNFDLKATTVAATEVEIVGVSATVDKTQTKTSTNFDLETLASLPVSSNAYGAIWLSPGVGGATDYPVVRGGLTGETAFMVNGISLKDPTVRQGRNYEAVLNDMIEDVAVMQSALNSRYGNNSGGLVAISTKTGKNYFEGTIRANLGHGWWNTQSNRGLFGRLGQRLSNPPTLSIDNISKTWEVTVFGPIIPDHLTFSFGTVLTPATNGQSTNTNYSLQSWRFIPNFQGASDNLGYLWGTTPNTSLTAYGAYPSEIYQYKLFWLIGQNHQVSAQVSRNPFGPYFQGWGGTDFVDYQSSDRDFNSIEYRGVFGGNGVLEARWGERINEIAFASGPGDPIYINQWYNNEALTSIIGQGNQYSAGSVLSNGQTGMGPREVRNSETWGVNYNWFTESHNIDFGVERLAERSLNSVQYGPNNQMFYSPARRLDGMYAVYNYIGSLAQTGTGTIYDNGVSTGYSYESLRAATNYIPQYRTTNWSGSGGDTNEYLTTSIYVNDLWSINDSWSIMAGLRYDKYTADAVSGRYIDSSTITPRFEVKYDPFGDNQHLFSFSYAHFRGTINSGSLTNLFGKYNGNQVFTYFWDKGTGTPENPQWVSFEDVINPSNYGHLYSMTDSHVQYWVDPGLKPTAAVEYALSYRRGFENGGSFRISAVFRDYIDVWQRFGTPDPVITNPVQQTYGGYMQILKVDPKGSRTHHGLEMEWSYPLYKSAYQNLHFAGNWTVARTKGYEPWREGNNSYYTSSRWPELYEAAGVPTEWWNPKGELRYSQHNVINTWITWNLGERGGIRHTFSMLGNYQTGAPMDRRASQQLNNTGNASNNPYWAYFNPTHDGSILTVNIPTAYNRYFNGRGKWTDMDNFMVDFKWNFTIPLKGKLNFFAEFQIGDIFNTVYPNHSVGSADAATALIMGYGGGTLPWDYDAGFQVNNFDRFGLINQRSGNRNYSTSLGLKF
ncbi:MAG: TonB-dependent receptor [Holophagaceae bacterium]|nr:TonB-dependent receptor [Holophagaceae bacterium]